MPKKDPTTEEFFGTSANPPVTPAGCLASPRHQ